MSAPIITVAQMREWEEATWASGRTRDEVIRRVGHIVADRALRMTRPADLVVVLAGKGHNGDDARHASQNLHGREVRLIDAADPGAACEEFLSQLALQPALIIDGIFGIGLNRPLDATWGRLIYEVNGAGVPILAVDVPSGLNADDGRVEGVAIQATVTLTLGAPKSGLLAPSAWPHVGRLEVAPAIGLLPTPPESRLRWTLPDDFAGFPPPRPVAGHKGTFGHLGIIAGSLGYHGASVLCARGALRARPGLVTLFTSENIYAPVAGQLAAAMVRPWRKGARFPDSFTAVVIGPGLAGADLPADYRSEVTRLWQTLPFPVVVDASALDWLPRGMPATDHLRVITPHPGEAARLLVTGAENVQRNRVDAVRELSRRYGNCWVVLKGHQTCIGRMGGEIFFNSSGNPHLAQGGAGDVLSGFIGGLLADAALARNPSLALRHAVWHHGAAADRLCERSENWGVEELANEIGNART
jgi:NAD(P)H-hydrate epimerase